MRFPQRVVMLVVVLTLAACSGLAQDTAADGGGNSSGGDAYEKPAEQPAEDAPAGEEPADTGGDGSIIQINDPETDTFPGPEGEAIALGPVLADNEGMTVYVLANDSENTSTCYDDCVSNWPPVPAPARAGEGVDQSLIGTTQRDDGVSQVTYAGQPLYYYAGDEGPGDVSGTGVGDVWWLVAPDGERIEPRTP